MMKRGRTNMARVNMTVVNRVSVNRKYVNRPGEEGNGGEGDYELIPNCWMLESGSGAWLWEDEKAMLQENVPALRRHINTK